MKAVFLRNCTLLLALPLAACASVQGKRASMGPEVTRSHLGQPIARAQIAVEAFDAADANLPEFRSYAAAVAAELTRLGWTVVNTVGQSEQVALVDVEQGTRASLQTGRVAAGMGAAAGAPGAVATRLEVRIKRRSDGTVFWEGRSIMDTTGGASATHRSAIVQNLARSLFQDFPGESGRTISTR
jgi:hypothetical protein